jgi:hypothetical protein
MIEHETLLVTLVKLVNRLPVPPPPTTRGRGRPRTYPDRLFLQAWVIMIVRHVHRPCPEQRADTAHGGEAHLAQPPDGGGAFPARCPWERRLQAIPETLPGLIQPWARCGRGAASGTRRTATPGACRTRSALASSSL